MCRTFALGSRLEAHTVVPALGREIMALGGGAMADEEASDCRRAFSAASQSKGDWVERALQGDF